MKIKFEVCLTTMVLALLLSLVLTSCAGKDNEDQFLPDNLPIYKDLTPVTLSFCFPGAKPKGWPEVKAELEKLTTDTLNATLDFKWFDFRSYMQKIQTLTASDESYDVLVCAQPQQSYPDFTKLAREGRIINGVDSLNLFSRGSGYVILDRVQKLVYKWDDPSMKVMAWESTPEFKTAVGYLASWYKNGYLAANPDPTRTASFVYYGMIGPAQEEPTNMTFTTTSGGLKESEPLSVFYLYPDSPVQRDNPMGRFYTNGSFIFSSNSKNTERALMFLQWVQQDPSNYMLMMYGLEKKDYVLENGLPTMPAGMNFQNRSYMYWDGSWAFSNLDNMPVNTIVNRSEIPNLGEFLDKNTKYPPHGAFYPDYSEISKAAADRSKSFSKFESNLREGLIRDDFEIDAFIKKLGDAGSGNIVNLAQRQLDKWKNK